jgi:hypothetical protein
MKKLKVTLVDRPVDVELTQYKRMFEAACSALGAIGDALGVDPEEGGAEPILAAIAELKLTSPPQRQPLTDEQVREISKKYALGLAFPYDSKTTPEMFARAIEAAHGIKEKNGG